jgi:hypothetical protein
MEIKGENVGIDLHWLGHKDQVHLPRLDQMCLPTFWVVGSRCTVPIKSTRTEVRYGPIKTLEWVQSLRHYNFGKPPRPPLLRRRPCLHRHHNHRRLRSYMVIGTAFEWSTTTSLIWVSTSRSDRTSAQDNHSIPLARTLADPNSLRFNSSPLTLFPSRLAQPHYGCRWGRPRFTAQKGSVLHCCCSSHFHFLLLRTAVVGCTCFLVHTNRADDWVTMKLKQFSSALHWHLSGNRLVTALVQHIVYMRSLGACALCVVIISRELDAALTSQIEITDADPDLRMLLA